MSILQVTFDVYYVNDDKPMRNFNNIFVFLFTVFYFNTNFPKLKIGKQKRLYTFTTLFLFYCIIPFLASQTTNLKREFRGVWVATVVNIDYPPKANKNRGVQKYEYIKMLEEFERMGINAVIFQVRPAADAFYESSYEPWSEYLTGTQGLAPEPKGYDPLKFMNSPSLATHYIPLPNAKFGHIITAILSLLWLKLEVGIDVFLEKKVHRTLAKVFEVSLINSLLFFIKVTFFKGLASKYPSARGQFMSLQTLSLA